MLSFFCCSCVTLYPNMFKYTLTVVKYALTVVKSADAVLLSVAKVNRNIRASWMLARQNKLSSAVLESETQSFSTKLRSAQNSGWGFEFVDEPPFFITTLSGKNDIGPCSHPYHAIEMSHKICRLLSLTSKRFRENIYRFENSWRHLAITLTVRLIVRHKWGNGLAICWHKLSRTASHTHSHAHSSTRTSKNGAWILRHRLWTAFLQLRLASFLSPIV